MNAFDDYQFGDYQSALNEIELASGNKNRPDVLLLKAMIFLKQERIEDAESALKIAQGQNPSAEIKKNVESLLKQIKEGEWLRPLPFWGFFDLASGYNSNVFTVGNFDRKASEPIFEGTLGIGYFYESDSSAFLRAQYFLDWSEIFNYSIERTVSHTVETPVGLELGKWVFQIAPQYFYQTYGGTGLVSKLGARFRAEYFLTDDLIGTELDYRKISALDRTYSYLKGNSQFIRTYWKHFFKSAESLLAVIYSKENIGDAPINGGLLPLANSSIGPSLTYTHYFAGVWRLLGSIAYYRRTYDHLESPDRIARLDQQLVFSSRATYIAAPNLQFYTNPVYTMNTSTLNQNTIQDKNYKQLVWLIGMEWNFL